MLKPSLVKLQSVNYIVSKARLPFFSIVQRQSGRVDPIPEDGQPRGLWTDCAATTRSMNLLDVIGLLAKAGDVSRCIVKMYDAIFGVRRR